mgnify:CR=1 FL=1
MGWGCLLLALVSLSNKSIHAQKEPRRELRQNARQASGCACCLRSDPARRWARGSDFAVQAALDSVTLWLHNALVLDASRVTAAKQGSGSDELA